MMSSSLLYQDIEGKIEGREEEDNYIEIPLSIKNNIKQELRAYQNKALENFIYYMEINKKYKSIEHKHLLFHMATGSGKTNLMASTILYLYSKGYRNFIFFVNTSNIISKTKDNLLNKYSIKYLFNEEILIDNKKVNINVIDDTFDSAKSDDINILFTTMHKLHGDLETTIKENSITYNDFEDSKLVHHLNASTKTEKESESNWELTTQNLLKINKDNILLEFTATQDMSHTSIFAKYQDKMIYDYPLKKFRADRYSKEIRLINSGLEPHQRMLQAIMISEYRQIVAEDKLNLYLKPVILFKNPSNTINSTKNYNDFMEMIKGLSVSDIDEVFKLSDIEMLGKLEESIKENKEEFVKRLQYSFNENNLILIHSKIKNKDELMQKYLNSLEDRTNHIRAIFAVNILNEGWDVLNLFDIVKLDEAKKGGKSTTSEAQLIGRGARYYPFEYKEEDRYKRKFDEDLNNELRVLEEMCFYSINQSDYIDTLTKELNKMGLMDIKEEERVELKLKDNFLDTELYKQGYIYQNRRDKRDKKKEVLGINFYLKSYKNNIKIYDKSSSEFLPFTEKLEDKNYNSQEEFKLIEHQDIIRVAINKKPFFYFSNLKKYFPNLKSIKEFIRDENYLKDIKFTVKSSTTQELNNRDKINLVLDILGTIENAVIKNSKEFIGSSTFIAKRISDIIPKSKTLKKKDSDSIINFHQDWYTFHKHGGTSEELKFIEFISSIMFNLEKKYSDIKLIRNEKSFEIYTTDKKRNGDRFEPDFVLILKSKKDGCYYQIFCEPKGEQLLELDKWKNDFLLTITKLTEDNKLKLECVNDESLKMYDNECYKIYGLPFYNDELKDDFVESFTSLLEV